jgi:sugar (pentulose or hexulose) kinase|nr:hypothetical protein [uncultured Schaedlerella sp.]
MIFEPWRYGSILDRALRCTVTGSTGKAGTTSRNRPAAATELAKKRAYASEATKKSRQKMYEEAATGNPEAVKRYENYLAARREAYHKKKQEAERTA